MQIERNQLVEDQLNAIDKISTWLKSSPNKDTDYLYTLAGFAGVGKTTTIKFILSDYKKRVAISAPTHTATGVIATMLDKPGETIQAILGLRPDVDLDDFNPNRPVFNPKTDGKIKDYDLIVIDEASMLNKEAVRMIIDKATEHNTKILFVGDKYQLPPVRERASSVFSLPNVVTLSQVMRQEEGNPLLELIKVAREDVIYETDELLNFIAKNPNRMESLNNEQEVGYVALTSDDFYKQLIESYFDTAYLHNPLTIKTIAWTNKTVQKANNYIKSRINPSLGKIAALDILVGYKHISLDINTPPFYKTIVRNSEIYKILSVDICTVVIANTVLKGYVVKTEGSFEDWFILHPESYGDFTITYKDKLFKGKSFKQWKQFYDFKNRILLLEDIFDNGVLVVSKDIDFGYASTVHKSQGSTYKNSAIIIGDIINNRKADERRRLLYVGLSRASDKNIILWK